MRRVLFLSALLVLVGSVAGMSSEVRGPILVLGNSDFTPENGVVAGTGIEGDPYVIAGWEIDVPAGEAYGVKIENASARFVLRGLIVRGAVAEEGSAIRLGFVSAATIEACSVNGSVNGIDLAASTDVTLRDNVLYVSGRGLLVTGESAEEYRHAIDESNVLNDYPIRYLYGRDGEIVSGITSSNLYVAASRNMTIKDNEILCGDGIQLSFVTDSLVTGNSVHRTGPALTEHGISLYRSDRNTISGNRAWNNRRAGIRLWLSSGNRVTGNELTANDTGLTLAASDDNEVSANAVMANPAGIELVAGSTGNVVEKNVLYDKDGKYAKYGVSVQQSANNRIELNAIVGVETGIELADQGNNNAVLANTIVGASGYGLLVTGSYNEIAGNLIAQKSQGILFPETLGKSKPAGNRIHDNVFTDNGRHLYLSNDTEANRLYRNAFFGAASTLVMDRGANTWTDSGSGNYWEDYAGADSNGDGIGDIPVLVVPSGSQDTAPLVSRSIALAGLGVLTRLEKAELKLCAANGQELPVPALVADEVHARFVGFRGFPASLFPGFPGILFVFEQDVDSRFTMETVVVPLDIAFFDSTGAYVGGATMEAGSAKLYTAGAPFSYALELPSGTLKAQGIGAGSLLVLPPGS